VHEFEQLWYPLSTGRSATKTPPSPFDVTNMAFVSESVEVTGVARRNLPILFDIGAEVSLRVLQRLELCSKAGEVFSGESVR
jgi:hypothetical protein